MNMANDMLRHNKCYFQFPKIYYGHAIENNVEIDILYNNTRLVCCASVHNHEDKHYNMR